MRFCPISPGGIRVIENRNSNATGARHASGQKFNCILMNISTAADREKFDSSELELGLGLGLEWFFMVMNLEFF